MNSINYSNQLRANCGHVPIYGKYFINRVIEIRNQGKLMNIDYVKESGQYRTFKSHYSKKHCALYLESLMGF